MGSRSASRSVVAGALLAVSLLRLAPAVAAAPPSPRSADAEPLVFLLQYLADDYPEAVADGKVLDDEEYRENRLFVQLIHEQFAKLRAAFPPDAAADVDRRLARLASLVTERGDVGEIRGIVETIVPSIVERFGLRVFPVALPDTGRAALHYAESCAVCHGDRGGGDGRAAAEIRPVPARFDDRAQMETVAPSVYYSAVSLGVPGTAMPAFGDALSEEERWGLVFYLWTFTASTPSPGSRAAVIPLRELATRPATELARSLARQSEAVGKREDEEALKGDIAALRAYPRLNDIVVERLSQMSFDVTRGVELARGGNLDAATSLVQASYIRQFEAIERPLFQTAPTLSRQVNREIRALYQAIHRGDGAMLETVYGLIERDLRSLRRRFEPKREDARRSVAVALGAGLIVLSLALVRGFFWPSD